MIVFQNNKTIMKTLSVYLVTVIMLLPLTGCGKKSPLGPGTSPPVLVSAVTTGADGAATFQIRGAQKTFYMVDENSPNVPLSNITVSIYEDLSKVNIFVKDDLGRYFSRYLQLDAGSILDKQSILLTSLTSSGDDFLITKFGGEVSLKLNQSDKIASMKFSNFESHASNLTMSIGIAYFFSGDVSDLEEAILDIYTSPFDGLLFGVVHGSSSSFTYKSATGQAVITIFLITALTWIVTTYTPEIIMGASDLVMHVTFKVREAFEKDVHKSPQDFVNERIPEELPEEPPAAPEKIVKSITIYWKGQDDKTPTENLRYSYRIELNGREFKSWTPYYGGLTSLTFPLHDKSKGTYTFYVRAKDEKGNVDPTPASASYVYK